MNNKYIITCPRCNAEYLLGEIFIPKYFFGNLKDIVKDENGQILSYYGNDLENTETYTCDYCKEKFKVILTIKPKIEQVEQFSEEYVTPIKISKLSLSEDI